LVECRESCPHSPQSPIPDPAKSRLSKKKIGTLVTCYFSAFLPSKTLFLFFMFRESRSLASHLCAPSSKRNPYPNMSSSAGKHTRLPTTTISPSPSPLLLKPPKHIRRSSNIVLLLPVPKTQIRGIHVSNILVADRSTRFSVTGFADKCFQSYTRHVDASTWPRQRHVEAGDGVFGVIKRSRLSLSEALHVLR
jgi:hypothetical protein